MNGLQSFIAKALDQGAEPEQVASFILSKMGSRVASLKEGIGESAGDAVESAMKILSSKGPITQYFGNYNPALYRGINQAMMNTGLDIGVGEGTKAALPPGVWEILEAATGGFNKGYGNSVLAKNAKTGEKLRFSHLSKINVKPGQKLANAVIGLTGATGNVTGPHLDLEYYDPSGKVRDFLRSPYAKYLY